MSKVDRTCCRVTILAFLMIMAGVLPKLCAANDWSGWRGNEAQGVSVDAGPTNWSPDENVIWKSEVTGKGHSSPVVAGDKVFVTTAYPTERGPELRPMAIRLTNALALIVGIATAFCLVSLVRANQFRLALGLSLFAGLFAKEFTHAVRYAFGTHREAVYLSWIDSHLVLGLACLVAIHVVTRKTRIIFGAALIALAATLALLRPDAEYYGFVSGAHHLRSTSSVILLTLALAGVASIITSLVGKQASKPQADAEPQADTAPKADTAPQGTPMLWVLVAFVAGLTSLGIPVLLQQLRVLQPELALPWIALLQIGGRTCAIAAAVVIWCVWGRQHAPERNYLGIAGGAVLVGALAFVTTNYLRSEDTHGRAIVCLDADTGKTLWTCENLYGPIPSTHFANSPATPTPVVDGHHVYAYFGTAGMMATDLDGNLLWTNTELPFEGIHGVAASPIARDGVVYLTSANSKAPFIVALDGGSGKRVWTADLPGWKGLHGEHRTPLIAEVNSKPMLLNWSMKSTELTGIDIRNGCQAYSHDTEFENTGEAVASLLIDDGILYLPSKSTIAAVRLPTEGTELEYLWQAELRSRGPNTASPVLHNGLMFLVSDSGIATCLDATNGKTCWKKRFPAGSYYSSPIVMGDHVYFSNDRGVTTVVESDRTFCKVAENELPDGIYASSAPKDGKLLIRTESALWCIGEQTLPTKHTGPSESTAPIQ